MSDTDGISGWNDHIHGLAMSVAAKWRFSYSYCITIFVTQYDLARLVVNFGQLKLASGEVMKSDSFLEVSCTLML